MKYSRLLLILFTAVVAILFSCKTKTEKNIVTKGIYGNPKPFWDRNINLPELGVNAIFVHSGSIDQEMISRAKSDGVKIYAEFATLNGKDYVKEHPEAWAINEKGEKVEAASWFMGVCPTEPGFRQFRMNQLRNLISQYDLDGVWMDYVHWHAQFEEPEPILPETCFCDHCLDRFSNDMGVFLPDGSTTEKARYILENTDTKWRDWRCIVIFEWASEIKDILKELKPGALLGLYHCPWDDSEFEGARRRILGLDYDLLKDVIDVFSPMVYHGRMGRQPEWVADNINWFCNRLEINIDSYPKVWPIIQAYDDPIRIDGEAFETVLKGGLTACSTGVMMFTTYAVAEDSIKTRIMQNLYTNLMNP